MHQVEVSNIGDELKTLGSADYCWQ